MNIERIMLTKVNFLEVKAIFCKRVGTPILSSLFLLAIISQMGCKSERQPTGSAKGVQPLAVESVRHGMSTIDVKNKLGDPDRIEMDDEGAAETWIYIQSDSNLNPGQELGGLVIHFAAGEVDEIRPIPVHVEIK